jgi:mannose-1-phosphate guanylyltransferase
MKALILLGGLGLRLRPLTAWRPKPLLPIVNRPFFSYQLDLLRRHGIKDVVLALGHKSHHFKKYLGTGRSAGLRFTYSLERSPLGTGGAIRNALPHLDGVTVVLNGDILCDLDLGRMWREHRRKKAQGSLALVSVKDPARFGLVETGRGGRIAGFIEKPTSDEITTNQVNAGFYILERALIEKIPPQRAVSVEREVFPQLVRENAALNGFVHKGYWLDIGTLASFWQAHRDLMTAPRLAALGLKKDRRGFWSRGRCRVGEGVEFSGIAVLGDGCVIGDRTQFSGRVCLGAGCRVGAETVLSDCVVLDNTRIGSQSRIESAIIGADCRLGLRVKAGPAAVVASRSVLNDDSQRVPSHFFH